MLKATKAHSPAKEYLLQLEMFGETVKSSMSNRTRPLSRSIQQYLSWHTQSAKSAPCSPRKTSYIPRGCISRRASQLVRTSSPGILQTPSLNKRVRAWTCLGKNPGPTRSTSVHVNDIAKMHVLALNPEIPGGNVFLGVSESSNTQWEDSFKVVRRHFPEAVKNGTFHFQEAIQQSRGLTPASRRH